MFLSEQSKAPSTIDLHKEGCGEQHSGQKQKNKNKNFVRQEEPRLERATLLARPYSMTRSVPPRWIGGSSVPVSDTAGKSI